MVRYVCMHCEYSFDPEVGDPEYNIAPGTYLEDLPEGWVCPKCSAGIEGFIEEDD